MAGQRVSERRCFQPVLHDRPPSFQGRRPPEQPLPLTLVIHTVPFFMAFVAVLLTVSFVILIASIVSGLGIRTMLLHPNPFAAYESVWPNQSIASVAAYAQHIPQGSMACVSGASPRQPYSSLDVRVAPGAYSSLGSNIRCMNTPRDGVFGWMTIAIDDNRVQELQLFSDGFRQDALLLYWGAPDAITRSGDDSSLHLYWEHSTYSAVASIRETD